MSSTGSVRRRTLFALAGAAAARGTLHGVAPAHAAGGRAGRHPLNAWVNQVQGPRPRFAWESREDAIYHEISYADDGVQRAPELWALMRCPWTFNRAMRWIRAANGTIICHQSGPALRLTGEPRVSDWHSDPENVLTHSGDALRFEKRSRLRARDAAVMPALQIHLGQTPVLELEVTAADTDWQLCVARKGRSGPPLWASDWHAGPARERLDLAAALARAGHAGQFAELHIIMGVWTGSPERGGTVTFRATLPSRPAVVPSLPVVRASGERGARLPLSAVATAVDGTLLRSSQGRIEAVVAGRPVALRERDGLWTGLSAALPVGEYPVLFRATGAVRDERQTVLRVCEPSYFTYDRRHNLVTRGPRDRHPGRPLTGSYQGTFFVRDAGLPSETLVQGGQAAWDNWDRSAGSGEHQHYWDSLTEAELDERFAYLGRCGWDLLHMHTHYGIWERFDAGGCVAPHGAEALARYVRIAARHGLAVMVTMSSYPYGVGTKGWADGTTPYKQYIEAGFTNEQWFDPSKEPFRTLYHRYLDDMLTLFAEESGIASFSSSGEGDWKNGPARFRDTQQVIRARDTRHLIVSEPVNMVEKLLPHQVEGFPSDLVGNRTYCIGWHMPFEVEMGIVFRLMRMVPNMYLAEGCYPSSNLYTHMAIAPDKEEHESWVGSALYRRNVRDVLYLGLVNRQPILMTWDEAFTEDERVVLHQVRELIDWRRPWRAPRVAIVVRDGDAHEKGRPALGTYERAFARIGLEYRFVASPAETAAGDWVIDHHGETGARFDEKAVSEGRGVPPAIDPLRLYQLGPGYAAHSSCSEDGRLALAYLFNVANHTTRKTYISPTYHRSPAPVTLQLTFAGLAPGLPFQLWDLDAKKVAHAGSTSTRALELPQSTADYLLVVGATGSATPA